MSNWRYFSTDLITGQVLADAIPLNVSSFSVALNGTGNLTGSLDLQQMAQQAAASGARNPYAVNQPFIEALEARRAVLWVLQDFYPVWAGVVWDWPDTTRQQGGPLPITAQTLDSVWQHRLITDSLTYTSVDLFTVFCDLATYGMTKTSPYLASNTPASRRPAGLLAWFASNGGVSRLILPTSQVSGVPWSISYLWSDQSQISSAWTNLVPSGDFEWAFTPGLDSSRNPVVFARLAYTQLGRPLGQSGYDLRYPGNAIDYGYQRTGSQGANWIWASAPPNATAQGGNAVQWNSIFPFGVDTGDLAAGYPIMETAVSWNNSSVTSQSQINAYAQGQLTLYSQAMTSPLIVLGGGSRPKLTDIVLGDAVNFAATSPLHPMRSDGSPGLQQSLRIIGWTAYPSGPNQAESIQLQTSAVAV